MEITEIFEAYTNKIKTMEQESLLNDFLIEKKHDMEDIKKCFDLYGDYDENFQYYLYDYNEFLEDVIFQNVKSYGEEYFNGFIKVFDYMSDDEQKRYVFHTEIKDSDEYFSNNYIDWKNESWMDRCLNYILEARLK